MKKVVFLAFLLVAVIGIIKVTFAQKEHVNPLLLLNIEALASDNEHADNTYCFGSGKLTCPVNHNQVEYIFGGYRFEE